MAIRRVDFAWAIPLIFPWAEGPLTQLVEYLPFKQRVTGSNPVRPTMGVPIV